MRKKILFSVPILLHAIFLQNIGTDTGRSQMMMTILYCCLGDSFDLGQLENVQVIESAQLGDIRGRRVHRLGVRDVVAVAHAHPGSLAGPKLAPARPGTVKLSTITIKTKKE